MVHVLSLQTKIKFFCCSGHRFLGEVHLDVVHSLALIRHGNGLRSARPGYNVQMDKLSQCFILLELYLERGVRPLPEPLPDADIVKVIGRWNVIRKAEEVQTKTIGSNILN